MCGQIQEGVNLGHTGSLRTVSNFYDVIAGINLSLLQHTKVKSWSVMCHEQSWHPRLIHADADAVAGYARLSHFKYCVANTVAIADAHLVIRKSLDREVFAELAKIKIIAAQKTLPIMVGVHLINKNGTVLPAVTSEIALPITVDIELAHHSSSLDWRFPD